MVGMKIKPYNTEGEKAMTYPFEDRTRKMEKPTWLAPLCRKKEGENGKTTQVTCPIDTRSKHVIKYKLIP